MLKTLNDVSAVKSVRRHVESLEEVWIFLTDLHRFCSQFSRRVATERQSASFLKEPRALVCNLCLNFKAAQQNTGQKCVKWIV